MVLRMTVMPARPAEKRADPKRPRAKSRLAEGLHAGPSPQPIAYHTEKANPWTAAPVQSESVDAISSLWPPPADFVFERNNGKSAVSSGRHLVPTCAFRASVRNNNDCIAR